VCVHGALLVVHSPLVQVGLGLVALLVVPPAAREAVPLGRRVRGGRGRGVVDGGV
jgi:hypothetical protein